MADAHDGSVTLIVAPLNMASNGSARPHFASQLHKERDRLGGHLVLRVIEIKTGGFDAQGLPQGIAGDELPQMQIPHLLGDTPPAPSTPTDQSAVEAEPPVW